MVASPSLTTSYVISRVCWVALWLLALAIIIVAIFMQCAFIYGMQAMPDWHDIDNIDYFLWQKNNFGVEKPMTMMENYLWMLEMSKVKQSAYSKFVFDTLAWWWPLPVLCAALTLRAFLRRNWQRMTLALVVSLAGTFALYWAFFEPMTRGNPQPF
jgi:hypothetical protein